MTWPFAEVVGIAALSLRVALIATAVACLLGLPVGVWLGTTAFAGRRALLLAVNAALGVPTVVIGLLVYLALSRHGPLGALGALFTWQAIVVAEILLAFPIAAALGAAATQALDPRVRRTALTLGAGAVRTTWAVAREARTPLVAAAVVAFGRVLSEVGAALIVGGNIRHQTRTLTTAITLATSQGQFEFAVALGLVLLSLALLVNWLILLLRGRADA